jgi:hypothetical protein
VKVKGYAAPLCQVVDRRCREWRSRRSQSTNGMAETEISMATVLVEA